VGEGIIAASGPPRWYEHGDVVVRQGEPTGSLRLITSGAIRLSAVTVGGREVVVALLGVGDIFGESALLGEEPSPVEARAAGGASIVTLPLGSLRAVLRAAPETAEELLRLVTVRLHRTSAALEEALAHDVPTRVRLRLRDLARSHGSVSSTGVRLPPRLTQDELARMVGASREAVNRSLVSLSARGLVRVEDRRYVVPDPDALAAASDR
jgi:CRP/FNR family transcriptional regulator, cyclic AMP receptor protein